MNGYILSPKGLTPVKTVPVLSYDLCIESPASQASQVTILGDLDRNYNQFIFRLEDRNELYRINGSDSGSPQQTTLKLADPLDVVAYVPKIFTTDSPEDNLLTGARFLSTMSNITPRGADFYISLFALDFLKSDNAADISDYVDGLNIDLTDVLQYKYLRSPSPAAYSSSYDAAGILRELQKRGIGFSLTPSSASISTVAYRGLSAEFFRRDYSRPIPVPFNDGHSQLLSEAYTKDICSCFYNKNDKQYFLLENGTISRENFGIDLETAEIIPQQQGYCIYDGGDYTDAEALEKAEAEFAKNKDQHKIEFASDKELHIGQPVTLLLSRGTLDTAISTVRIKSGDSRYHYTCGEIPVTASEQIKAGSWSFGARRPMHPREGELFFEE